MRIPFAFAAALLCAASPAPAADRNFGVSGFDRIRVEGPFKVQVRTGIAPFARASGSAQAIDRVAMSIQGRTLVIRNSQTGWGGYPGQPSGPVEIEIGTHELGQAILNGAGTLAITRAEGLSFELAVQGSGSASIDEVAVDQMKVALSGTASARLAGKAPKLTAVVRGISTLAAAKLVTRDAEIGAEGPATVRINATGTAKIDAQGAATVELSGRPACTARTAGSATVSGCR